MSLPIAASYPLLKSLQLAQTNPRYISRHAQVINAPLSESSREAKEKIKDYLNAKKGFALSEVQFETIMNLPEVSSITGLCFGYSWTFANFLLLKDFIHYDAVRLFEEFYKTHLPVHASALSFISCFDFNSLEIDGDNLSLKEPNFIESLTKLESKPKDLLLEYTSSHIESEITFNDPLFDALEAYMSKKKELPSMIAKLSSLHHLIEDVPVDEFLSKEEAHLSEEEKELRSLIETLIAIQSEKNDISFSFYAKDLKKDLIEWSSLHDGKPLMLRFSTDSGNDHAVCCYCNTKTNEYIYFDSSSELVVFENQEKMSDYVAKQISRDYGAYNLNYAVFGIKHH